MSSINEITKDDIKLVEDLLLTKGYFLHQLSMEYEWDDSHRPDIIYVVKYYNCEACPYEINEWGDPVMVGYRDCDYFFESLIDWIKNKLSTNDLGLRFLKLTELAK